MLPLSAVEDLSEGAAAATGVTLGVALGVALGMALGVILGMVQGMALGVALGVAKAVAPAAFVSSVPVARGMFFLPELVPFPPAPDALFDVCCCGLFSCWLNVSLEVCFLVFDLFPLITALGLPPPSVGAVGAAVVAAGLSGRVR